MQKLDTCDFCCIVALTGAGISAGSSLRTFRGPDGLWTEADPVSFSSLQALQEDPLRVRQFYGAA